MPTGTRCTEPDLMRSMRNQEHNRGMITMSRKYMGRRTSCMHPRLNERPMYFSIIIIVLPDVPGQPDYFSRMIDMPGRRLGTLLVGRILTSKVLLSYWPWALAACHTA